MINLKFFLINPAYLTNLDVVRGTDGCVALGLQRLPEAKVVEVRLLVAVDAHQQDVV